MTQWQDYSFGTHFVHVLWQKRAIYSADIDGFKLFITIFA